MRRTVEIKLRRFWHAHRWHLVAVLAALPIVAVMVHSAGGETEPRAQAPSRAVVCRSVDQATDEISSRYPDVSREALDDLEEQACTRDPMPAPVSKPAAIPSTPGCHLLEGSDRRAPARVRAEEPARPIPFFAPRSGRLPETGTPVVGGVRLPAGSRCGPFWSTDAGVTNGLELARKLAAAFSKTGLWPVLWPGEEPDWWVNGGGNPARIGSLDAELILRRAWQKSGEQRPFPGLAEAQPAAKRLAVEPFGDVLEASLGEQPGGPILMLVAANRPADVMEVLGGENTEYFSDRELSAVLRSWEERFGAVVATLGEAEAGLVVGAPPREDEQVDRLAAELTTLAPDAYSVADLKVLLRSDRHVQDTTSPRYWALGWPD